MTTRASITGYTRIKSSLEIVYMLRMYQFSLERDAYTTITPSPKNEDTMRNDEVDEVVCILNNLRTPEDTLLLSWIISHIITSKAQDEDTMRNDEVECILKLNNLSSKPEDTLSISHRTVNIFWKSRLLSGIRSQHITSKAQDEDTMRNLINMLNMLSWYKFDSKMKASTSASMAPTITSHERDNKWRLKTEVMKLFNKALEDSFSEFKEKWMMTWCKKDGDFQCDNVLTIWPQIKKRKSINNNKKRYSRFKGPIDVGKRIKEELVKLNSDTGMIEGQPFVYGVGFVNIKLSGNWMAANIHKMLKDGIDTWAPRQQLDFKRTIINSTSWDESNLMPMDVLRRQFIIMSRMHILEFAKYAATTSTGNGMSLPLGKLEEHFRWEEKDGKMMIYVKDERNTKPLICGKIRGKSLGERDGCFGYPLEDLGALWHGFSKENADWIVCVTPSQQQDYVEECFEAADYAGWTTTDRIWPLATYVGFKTSSTSLEDLLSFLYKAEYPSEAGEAAKVLGYTDEAVLDCALTYTFLKYHRLADCTFSYHEMLDAKGNTFVRLLTTQAQIRKITNHSLKDIDELKKASELGLEQDKIIWSNGVERELGFHLLMFTELISESCLSFFPHLLCGYLYNLSEKFSLFYETCASSGFEEKTRLLLCEATAVVMEKGFHLLGITQKPSLKAVSAALALNYVSPLEVRNPLENLNIRTRFEVFTVYLHITRDHEFEDGELFGNIQVSDDYGLVPDGWGKLLNPGPGRVSLFDQDWRHPVKMKNNSRLKIGNPSSRHSVPFSSSMRIVILFYATKKNEFFEVCNHHSYMKFSSFLDDKSESGCKYLVAGGDDGHMRMHFVLLRDALDATIKVKFLRVSGRKVCGEILAYYDNFEHKNDDLEKSFYKASLFESFDDSVLEAGDVPLTRYILAVPNKGSLVIEAHLTEYKSGDDILRGSCVFSSLSNGRFKLDIEGTLEVEINCN